MNEVEILVVDDTVANLEVVCQILEDAGYEVATALNGERALELVQAYPPDLILLDVQMPGINGFEACKTLKANPETVQIPIIFMTAFSDIESKVKGFDLGAVDYITKPFQEKELLARVKAHVQLRLSEKRLEALVEERTRSLQIALRQLEESQLQLIHNEKMSMLGNLVAGVAHEINNPIGFLKGGITNAKDYVRELLGHLELYEAHCSQVPIPVADNAEEIELDFLRRDLPKLLDSMQGAVARITSISTSLRTFSRTDTDCKTLANLHEGIESTLLMLKYRLKANERRPAIETVERYGQIPELSCFPGQLNQVFMNILANAIDTLDEAAQSSSYAELQASPQQITIATRYCRERDEIVICIRDNGKGMSKDVRERIFDRAFTTKTANKGTGLGLAIARQIVEKHSGSIRVQSELGWGTEFCISLPVGETIR